MTTHKAWNDRNMIKPDNCGTKEPLRSTLISNKSWQHRRVMKYPYVQNLGKGRVEFTHDETAG